MNRRFIALGVVVMAVFLAAVVYSEAGARPRKKAPEPAPAIQIAGPSVIDPTFEKFHFGMTKDELTEFVKGRVRDHYKAEMSKTADIRAKDDLLNKMKARLDEVASDWIVFDGSKAGWNVSIIRHEFKNGMGEEALRVQEGYENFYYFLKDGRVYKLVRTWEMKSFPPIRDMLVKAYGPAVFEMRPGDYDRRFLSDMRWHGANVTVDVEDWTEAFKSYTVRWADAAVDREVLKSWGDPDQGLQKLNPLIDAAKEPPKKKSADPVDELLGR